MKTAIHSNCEKCGEPLKDGGMLLTSDRKLYHIHCSPYTAYQRAEEHLCTCGAAGSGEGHTDWCAWQSSEWRKWGDAFNAGSDVQNGTSELLIRAAKVVYSVFRDIPDRALPHNGFQSISLLGRALDALQTSDSPALEAGVAWQTMDSAPKDGKHVLLCVQSGPFYYAVEGALHGDNWLAAFCFDPVHPVYWAPKPTGFVLPAALSIPAKENGK